MSKLYHLDVMTPKHRFFSGEVEALTISAPDGELTVLAGHTPLVSALAEGSFAINTGGVWREAFHAEGFVEVTAAGVTLFAQVCEWAEDIDAGRAFDAKSIAEERLRQQQSINESKITKISLARAMARLRIKNRTINH